MHYRTLVSYFRLTDYQASTNLEHDLLMRNTDDKPHLIEDEEDDVENVFTPLEETPALSLVRSDRLDEFFKSLDNARVGHWGPSRMFQMANRQMPDHGFPLRLLKEFVSSCINCQKERLDLNDRLTGIMKNKKVPNAYSAIGMDNLTVTPRDMNGMIGLCNYEFIYTICQIIPVRKYFGKAHYGFSNRLLFYRGHL